MLRLAVVVPLGTLLCACTPSDDSIRQRLVAADGSWRLEVREKSLTFVEGGRKIRAPVDFWEAGPRSVALNASSADFPEALSGMSDIPVKGEVAAHLIWRQCLHGGKVYSTTIKLVVRKRIRSGCAEQILPSGRRA